MKIPTAIELRQMQLENISFSPTFNSIIHHIIQEATGGGNRFKYYGGNDLHSREWEILRDFGYLIWYSSDENCYDISW